MDWLFPTLNFFQKKTLRVFSDWKVTGRENVPPMGPLIIVANHQSNLDPPVLGASLPRRMSFLAKSGIFKGSFARWFLTAYGAFPINREGVDVRAYRWIFDQLKHDKAIVFFPEGTRTQGGMIRAKPGIAQIAIQSQAPILPVGISGTEVMGTWMRVFKPTGTLRVNIGPAFSLPQFEGKPSKEVLESLTDMIMLRVAQLLPESYQGVYKIHPEGASVPSDRR